MCAITFIVARLLGSGVLALLFLMLDEIALLFTLVWYAPVLIYLRTLVPTTHFAGTIRLCNG